jgi:magnesium transporter
MTPRSPLLEGELDIRTELRVQFTCHAGVKQTNEEKKISAWVAILFAPAPLIAAIYGMNFEFMPELHWTLGYPFALLLMVLVSVSLYVIFERRGWL